MVKSMTGFGRGVGPYGDGECVVEVRSVNHRFLTVNVQCPRAMLSLENRVRKFVQEKFDRGHFDVSIVPPRSQIVPGSLHLNTALAEEYVALLRNLRSTLALEGEVTLDLVARMRDVITFEEEPIDADELWQVIQAPLSEASSSVIQVRAAEGAALRADVKQRLESISAEVDVIEAAAATLPQQYRDRLHRRIQELVSGVSIDELRIEQEVAIYAERSDVSEEITRLRSHIRNALGLLELDEPVGRKLDFYVQEMHREATTIGAKAGGLEISQRVVAVKDELEKIRQQVQNIE